jgi:hypothetical protein
VNRLKRWRGIATRYEKRAVNYRSKVVIAALMIWLISSITTHSLGEYAEARKEQHRRVVRTRGLKRSSTFETTKHSEPHFRALLADGGAERLELVRI